MRDLFGNEISDKMSGKDFEKLIAKILKENKSLVAEQVDIGIKFNNKRHIIDILVNGNILISIKWQYTGGTAEEKVVYEMGTLQDKINFNGYKKAFVILGGPGWTIFENLKRYSKLFPEVTLTRYEDDKTLSFIKNEIK